MFEVKIQQETKPYFEWWALFIKSDGGCVLSFPNAGFLVCSFFFRMWLNMLAWSPLAVILTFGLFKPYLACRGARAFIVTLLLYMN